jgi:hypothetical protein
MTATLDEAVADLQRANTELQRKVDERAGERDDALAKQAAGAEVLQVINSSPSDLAPVFKSMLEKAVGLCDLDFSGLFTYDGQHFHGVSAHRLPERGFSARAHSNKLTNGFLVFARFWWLRICCASSRRNRNQNSPTLRAAFSIYSSARWRGADRDRYGSELRQCQR